MKTILLSYVGFPTTTAYYFEKAFRKENNVITIGPSIAESMIRANNIDLPEMILDITTPLEFDILEVFNHFLSKNITPEIFVWIESAVGFEPRNVDKLPVPTACYLIDTHLHLKSHIQWALNFNHVFIAQKEYIEEFKKAGVKNIHWLPLACDPEIHQKSDIVKDREIGFVGSFINNPRRSQLLQKLEQSFDVKIKRCFYQDMALEFSKSKIVFNNAVKRDLNMRVFEALSTGSFLLTDDAPNSGFTDLFKNNEDLTVYNDDSIEESVQFYLENEELREKIAARGREICLTAHKYTDRCKEIINVTLDEKNETFSVRELRELSVNNCTVSTNDINRLKRSFIIPVLDYSPASCYNINTLLKDLESVEGNVIVIFNNQKVADEVKNHPRIDYYSVMSHNVGVARAWNIGLDMVQTPIAFILNADLHIEPSGVELIENALISLPSAGCVGAQGSYFNFFTLNDHSYFGKKEFNEIIEVDAVSGFYFAVKTKHFHQGLVKFENNYTPCWYEEWDLGLQLRAQGLKSYIVPTDAFDHQFGGSIKATQEIRYFNKTETKQQIIDRNAKYFIDKWYSIQKDFEKFGKFDFLFSELIKQHLNKLYSLELTSAVDISEGLKPIKDAYSNNFYPFYLLAQSSFLNNQKLIAKQLLEYSLEYNPDYNLSNELMDILKK